MSPLNFLLTTGLAFLALAPTFGASRPLLADGSSNIKLLGVVITMYGGHSLSPPPSPRVSPGQGQLSSDDYFSKTSPTSHPPPSSSPEHHQLSSDNYNFYKRKSPPPPKSSPTIHESGRIVYPPLAGSIENRPCDKMVSFTNPEIVKPAVRSPPPPHSQSPPHQNGGFLFNNPEIGRPALASPPPPQSLSLPHQGVGFPFETPILRTRMRASTSSVASS